MSARFMSITHVLLRVVAGFLFMCHGGQKLFGWFGGMPPAGGPVPLASLMGVAGILEFFGGLALFLGFLARPAAFLLAGEMAVAYFTVHQKMGPLPIVNRGEPAVLLCFACLFLLAHGPGPWSADAFFGRARKHRAQQAQSALRRRGDEPFPGQAA